MKKTPVCARPLAPLLLAVVLAFSAAAARADDEDAPWKIRWDDTFKLDSPDGRFKLQFGGRLELDATFAGAGDAIEAAFGPVTDGTEVRRARPYVAGTLYERVEFKLEYDFASGDAVATDLYVGLKDTAIGGVRLGHFKEPFSLEELTSEKYNAFVERSLPSVFNPVRNVGVMAYDAGERYTWAAGAFRESDEFAVSSGSGVLNLTGRVTGVPVYRDDAHLLHLGLGVSRKDLGDDLFRFRQRPEAHQAPRFVDTGAFAAAQVRLWDLELALVWGAFWAAAELAGAEADAVHLGDPSFRGSYVQAGWFLTGQHRPYRRGHGDFHRLKLAASESFGGGGRGAWEVAVRWSTLDLDDAAVAGGELDDVTVGLNWYLNSVTRFMLNVVRSDVAGVGEADFVLLRVQVEL
ncbi:MAG TPA: porin [Thermoanaerobaculia bacterium]